MSDNGETDRSFDLLKLWKEYEGVAMHFNDLIIKLRSQSLAAVAAFATLAAVVARADTATEIRWGLLTGAFGLLTVFWGAVWALDLGYYNRLLAGAVDALLDIESKSKESASLEQIELSTMIEKRVKDGGVGNNNYRLFFYIVVFVALVLGFIISVCMLCKTSTT